MLTKGSKGEAVVRLQKALQEWNSGALPKHGPDGSYGNETIEWVKQYQQEMGLQAIGNIDGVTAELLVGASSKENTSRDPEDQRSGRATRGGSQAGGCQTAPSGRTLHVRQRMAQTRG